MGKRRSAHDSELNAGRKKLEFELVRGYRHVERFEIKSGDDGLIGNLIAMIKRLFLGV